MKPPGPTTGACGLSSAVPAPSGEHCVGVTRMFVTDAGREDPFAPGVGTRRHLLLQIFYPAQVPSRPKPTPYFTEAEYDHLRGLIGDLPRQMPERLVLAVVTDAAPKPTAGGYPVLLFSHGAGSFTARYADALAEVASHGYVVVGVNHPYVAGVVTFPDGYTARVADPRLGKRNMDFEEALGKALPTTTADQGFVLAELRRMGGAVPRWRDMFDLARVGTYGHSYGGVTAFQLCEQDPTPRACLNLDGFFGPHDRVDLPSGKPEALVFSQYWGGPRGDALTDASMLTPVAWWNSVKGPLCFAVIGGTLHSSFDDLGMIVSVLGINSYFLGLGDIDPFVMHRDSTALWLSYFDALVKNGAPGALRTGLGRNPSVTSWDCK